VFDFSTVSHPVWFCWTVMTVWTDTSNRIHNRQRQYLLLLRYISTNLSKPTGHLMHRHVWHSKTVHSAHTIFMCFASISDQTATFALYNINWLGFITEKKSVYCAVRTGCLNKAICASSLKGLRYGMFATTERIWSRQTFLASLWFGSDGSLLCFWQFLLKKTVLTKRLNVQIW
jgi:hypothetical protein